MPTPFTHLETAQRLLQDDQIPQTTRNALADDAGAFFLGNVAADARTESGLRREDTHFYSYDKDITDHPWRVMMSQNPGLITPDSPAQRAFVAGYVAHLSIDEWWSLYMLGPHFARREWAPRPFRFLMLHMLLIYMDERDYGSLESWQYEALCHATPLNWLPFMNDAVLVSWRDFIAEQVSPGGESLTLAVLGARIDKTPAELRAILDSPAIMDSDLWQHITPGLLAEVEAGMYHHARREMLTYWDESAR